MVSRTREVLAAFLRQKPKAELIGEQLLGRGLLRPRTSFWRGHGVCAKNLRSTSLRRNGEKRSDGDAPELDGVTIVMIVSDTTLISYITIEGDYTKAALAVRSKDSEWAAPLLWESEFANVLWMYVRTGAFDLTKALRRLDVARDLLAGRTFPVSISDAPALASDSGCTVYDCQYVTLARQLSVPFVTHEREVLAAFPGIAVRPDDFLRA